MIKMCIPYITNDFLEYLKQPGYCARCGEYLNDNYVSVLTDKINQIYEIICLKCAEDG